MALKLHKQFGHPSVEKLLKLIRDANINDRKLEVSIAEVTEKCEICCRFKKARPCPIVSMPLASKFNDVVAFDLKVYERNLFLVMVDHATRFCAATIVSNKRPSTIIKGIFLSWIAIFGAPNKFLSDNGGEFNNSEMRELGEQFNIKILTTAAESPWSNGVCERLNAILGCSVRKIQEDTGCSTDVALAWAVSSRNALSNFSGYAPNQLVFGHNPVLPNVCENSPPALDAPSTSQIVKDNLNAMHSSRQDFIRRESDERIKRALRHNIRESYLDDIETGQEVFYKRADSNKWHGPGVVIGRDGKQVLVKHGGIYVRVHSCRLSQAPKDSLELLGHQEEEIPVLRSDPTRAGRDCVPASASNFYPPEEDEGAAVSSSSNNEASEQTEDHDINDEEVATPQAEVSQIKPKVGLRMQGVHTGTGELFSGKIISRAGKSTGKYKNCFNVKSDVDGELKWVNFDNDFSTWKVTEEDENMLILFSSDVITEAKEKEVANWVQNEVYEEVEFCDQELLSVRWVVSEKVKNGQPLLKARLVVRGFEEYTEGMRKDSPTCSKESVRLCLAIAVSRNWECHSLDVKAAYLQGDAIQRDIFVNPPPEFRNGKVWKLKKTVYGLCDAARSWYLRVRTELQQLGVSVCTVDPALFYWMNGEECEGLICVYVDDFLWAGTKAFEDNVISKVRDMFLIGGSECKSFKYIGLNIQTFENGIHVDQCHYASAMRPICISKQRSMQKESELTESEKTEYRALVGQLNWISTHTRPDISFDVCEISTHISNARIGDLLRLNKVIERVIHDQQKVFFPKMQALSSCHLECFSDASFGNLSDCGSQGAFVIFLKDDSGKRCPLLWQSKKLRRVVKSTLSAETMALLDCAESAVYINHILSELTGCQPLKINCFVDNKSLVDALQSTNVIEDRRLRIDMAVIRCMLEKREIHSVSWVATSKQLADCLTKRGASTMLLRAALSV